jgi:DinB superfamily
LLDFTPVRNKEKTITQLAEGLTIADLRNLTNEMVDKQLALIADCVDADVVFVPNDPTAKDDAAADAADVNLAWNLGHVIVHATASSDEYSFIAAELARGVTFHGRSRAETPWQSVKSIAQCRQRLEESRRQRLASLDIWPDAPHYENTYQPAPDMEPINCVNRFVRGLSHDDSHLNQIVEIVRQARAAHN